MRDNFSHREAFPPPVFLPSLCLLPWSTAKADGNGVFFSPLEHGTFACTGILIKEPLPGAMNSLPGEGTGLCYSRRLAVYVGRKHTKWHPCPGKQFCPLSGHGKVGFLLSCWGGLSQLWETPVNSVRSVALEMILLLIVPIAEYIQNLIFRGTDL